MNPNAAFSIRDTAEDLVYDGKLWLSNGFFNGNILTRDLWSTTDGVTWTRVNDNTPYDGYSEMVVYDGKMWAIKESVWTSTDGVKWERVSEKTPFGVRGYGEAVVFKDRIWQLGSGADVEHHRWRELDVRDGERGTETFCLRRCCLRRQLWLMADARRAPTTRRKRVTTRSPRTTTFVLGRWRELDAFWNTLPGRHGMVHLKVYATASDRRRHDNVNSRNFGDVWSTKDGKTWSNW